MHQIFARFIAMVHAPFPEAPEGPCAHRLHQLARRMERILEPQVADRIRHDLLIIQAEDLLQDQRRHRHIDRRTGASRLLAVQRYEDRFIDRRKNIPRKRTCPGLLQHLKIPVRQRHHPVAEAKLLIMIG